MLESEGEEAGANCDHAAAANGGGVAELSIPERISRYKKELERELADLEEQLKKLREHTHEGLEWRSKSYARDVQMRSVSADRMIEYHHDFLDRQLVADRKKAFEEWESKRHELKKRWQTELERERAMIKERYEVLQIDGEAESRMRLRLRRHKDEGETPPVKVSRKEGGGAGPVLVWELTDNEIGLDLDALCPGSKRPAQSAPPLKGAECYYDADRLCFDGKYFYRGSRVAVEWQDGSNQRIVGTIHSLNQSEVWIRRQDNLRTRIFLSMLVKGKYSIKNFQGRTVPSGPADGRP